ncbi:MAG TPA: helix-turn-helix domain-containing protein [Terracidiphilus sp.]
MTEVDEDLRADPRWQLIERITASGSFQKSARLRDLLRFLAERSLHGQLQDLSEHRIGSAVFGKAQDYSVVEDSSVRVHVRQLRLKLHEYFDGEGRGESCIVEIPKGAYTTQFRTVEHSAPAPLAGAAPSQGLRSWRVVLPWVLAGLFLLTTLGAWLHKPSDPPAVPPPWPLTSLFDSGNHPVQLVVADINYGMMRLVNEEPISLEEYLSPSYRSGNGLANAHPTVREARMTRYLSDSLLTSYADLVVATKLLRISGDARDRLVIRSARELRPRDLEQGSFVFVGSPSSNPWVGYFEDKLNFREHEGVVGESLKFFDNTHPRSGEQQAYQGLKFTGSSGEDYATISLLPFANGRGSVLILQGLQQEGTEAAGLFLADPGNRQKLRESLGISANPQQPVYFEALIRTQAVAGAPNATSIVATRVIHP